MTRTTADSAKAGILAALMVFSIFASTVAFAGGAAAVAGTPATVSDTATDAESLSPNGQTHAQATQQNDVRANASDLKITNPTTRQTLQSSDLLDVTFKFTENAPTNPQSTTITLVGPETYRYNVSVSSYAVGAEQSLTLDLDEAAAELTDGAYAVKVSVKNETGNVKTASTEQVVVINDDAPTVSGVSLNKTADVDPATSLEVTYDYESSLNTSSVTVWVVDAETVEEFKNNPRNATYTKYTTKVNHGTATNQKLTVDLASRIADNDDYRVFVTATDVRSQRSQPATAPSLLDVNAEQPAISSVEANAGSNTVTVKFNEAVVPIDGDTAVTRADFDFQNTNGVGPTAIESVVAHGGDTVVLRLDSTVESGDIGSDKLSVRAGQIADVDGENARMVNTNPVVLNDTTAPTLKSGYINAVKLSKENQDSYIIGIETTSEPTDVSGELIGMSGSTVSNSTASVTGVTSLTFDASSLADGPVTVSVTLTDAGGNTVTRNVTVVKDTVAPTLTVAAANPAGSPDTNGKTRTVTVVFSEDVDPETVTAGAFNLTNSNYEVVAAADSASPGSSEASLTLNRSVAPQAIGNSSVITLTAPGVTDYHGYEVGNGVALTDTDAGGGRAPPHQPTVANVAVQSGDTKVTLTYDEVVRAGNGSALTAANFSYIDTNNQSAGAVSMVTQTGPQTVVVTLDEPLDASGLANDQIRVAAGEVVDTSGNAQVATTLTFGINTGLTVELRSSTDRTVSVQVKSVSDISTALSGPLSVAERNRELTTLEGFGLEDRFTTTIAASDFTEVRPGVYTANVTLPEDGVFSVSGVVNGVPSSGRTTVNTEQPAPTDAVVLDVTSTAQLDEERNTTRLRVLFSEPVVASDIGPSDVSIEGFNGEIIAVQNAGSFGAIEILVEGKVRTGSSPEVTIAGDSYTDLGGTTGASTGSAVVHTDVLELSEGRNFVSVPAATGSLPISDLDTSAIDAIYAYDAANKSWQSYDPDAMENDFTTLEGGKGYIVMAESDVNLAVNVHNVAGAGSGAGDAATAPNQQTLTEGWNLVGHYEEYNQRPKIAFSSISNDALFKVLAYDEAATRYKSLYAGDFRVIQRGDAYWVFVRSSEVYTAAPANATASMTAPSL